jgi:hypothetical protein
MTEWALTVAEALGLKPEAFHEPTRVGDVFTVPARAPGALKHVRLEREA